MTMPPRKIPRIIHFIAFCYLLPIIVVIGLTGLFGFYIVGYTIIYMVFSELLFLIPLLISVIYIVLILWTIYRPTKNNRWFPFAIPIISLVIIVLLLAATLLWPILYTSVAENFVIVYVGAFFVLCTVTRPTLLGAGLLLTIPSAKSYLFNKVPAVPRAETDLETNTDTAPISSDNCREEQIIISQDHKAPQIIIFITGWYLFPPIVVLAALFIFGYYRDLNTLEVFLSVLIPVLYTILILWAIYRPNKINRWFPLAMPIISIVPIMWYYLYLVAVVEEDAGIMGSIASFGLYIFSFAVISMVTVPTTIGAVLLLAIPSVRKYYFNR